MVFSISFSFAQNAFSCLYSFLSRAIALRIFGATSGVSEVPNLSKALEFFCAVARSVVTMLRDDMTCGCCLEVSDDGGCSTAIQFLYFEISTVIVPYDDIFMSVQCE